MSLRLNLPERPEDWADCHSGALAPPDLTAKAAFQRALLAAPAWMGAAMALRNTLVKPFGLVTEAKGAPPGAGFLDRMPVLHDTPELYETGMTDKHLTFTLRVETRPAEVAVRTRIWFHSLWGRAYLRGVLPAHNLILRRMVGSLDTAP